MADPTPAEIEAGALALDPDPEMNDLAWGAAAAVLRAVLPLAVARLDGIVQVIPCVGLNLGRPMPDLLGR